MKLSSKLLDLNLNDTEKKIRRFINTYVEDCGAKGIVIGLSGGIDSATIAALSALAIGGENVTGLLLPEEETYNSNDIIDAKIVARKFNLKTQICDITPVLRSFYDSIPIFDLKDRVCRGNIKARTRMIYLYYYSNKLKYIVCGSSDKSEIMMGYFTKWGDVAADISPIMDLYKTQVRRLAEHISIPKNIVEKESTPALWLNQFAENELGIEYELLDLILYSLERFFSTELIATQLEITEEQVKRVKSQWLAAEHKRRMPLTTKIEYRSVGIDFRLPRSFY